MYLGSTLIDVTIFYTFLNHLFSTSILKALKM